MPDLIRYPENAARPIRPCGSCSGRRPPSARSLTRWSPLKKKGLINLPGRATHSADGHSASAGDIIGKAAKAKEQQDKTGGA